jgi:uncharacterized protein YrrD
MLKVELKEGTSVFTSGGEEVGKINRFVLDPATNEVTHIVVQKGWLFAEDKVVPFEMVSSATEDRVVLNENIENFDELPPFEESHYIRTRDADLSPDERSSSLEEVRRGSSVEGDISRAGSPRYSYAPAYYWYPPHGYVGYPVGFYGWPPMETIRNIPQDTIPLREGTDVMSSDGKHVGDVERLFVETDSNRATHFAISQGVFFKDHKLIPAHWIKSVGEDKVHLAVSSELLESLPAYEPK